MSRSALQCSVRSRIPVAHRVRHLAVFYRLLLFYNLLASAIGSSALIVLTRAGLLGPRDVPGTGAEDATGDLLSAFAEGFWLDELQRGLLITGILVATVGHWLAVLVVNLAHRDELALYRGGGWGPQGLWFASWVGSALVGALLAVLGALS